MSRWMNGSTESPWRRDEEMQKKTKNPQKNYSKWLFSLPIYQLYNVKSQCHIQHTPEMSTHTHGNNVPPVNVSFSVTVYRSVQQQLQHFRFTVSPIMTTAPLAPPSIIRSVKKLVSLMW